MRCPTKPFLIPTSLSSQTSGTDECRLGLFGLVSHAEMKPSLIATLLLLLTCSCATIRTTDPSRTATEQFLISTAAIRAVDQLASTALRDRKVFIDPTFFISDVPTQDQSFLLGELRAKLLTSGVRVAQDRADAQVILEVRSGGLGVDRYEYLLGIPSVYLNGSPTGSSSAGTVPVATPELAIVKTTRQRGYAGVAFVAYWSDTGELIASSGPFVGRTVRSDFWFFGIGPRTVGNIPPAEK
jgi:hypothetical protein